MSGNTTNLKLDKYAGNLAGLNTAQQVAAMDANLDNIDAAVGVLQTSVSANTTALAALAQKQVAAADGAINIKQGTVFITKTTAAALTLAAPTAGTDDDKSITILGITAHAHTVTTPANKINGSNDTVTFAAPGDAVTLTAYNGVWYTTALGGPTPASLSEV